MRYCRKLEVKDVELIPQYAGILHEGLEKLAHLDKTDEVKRAQFMYNRDYLVKSLTDGKLIGHFNEENLDGVLVEELDTLNFDNTCVKNNVLLIKWLASQQSGIGIGGDLVKDCISRASAEKRDAVAVGVFENNPSAMRLYIKNGFVENKRKEGIIGMYHFLNPKMDPLNIMTEIYSQMFGQCTF